jgi:hypothetical protein
MWTNQSFSNMSFWLRIECLIMECCNFSYCERKYTFQHVYESTCFWLHTHTHGTKIFSTLHKRSICILYIYAYNQVLTLWLALIYRNVLRGNSYVDTVFMYIHALYLQCSFLPKEIVFCASQIVFSFISKNDIRNCRWG